MASYSNDSRYTSNIANGYVKKPKDLSGYTAYRGVTDFTNIGQFNQFETGYSFLFVLQMPKFMQELSKYDSNIGLTYNQFKHILEYEFRGLDGLPDIGVENNTITNGVQEINMINKVTEDSAVTISMNYFEKSGSPITKFSELYLTGIKDKRSQAKHYHGLIAQGLMQPGYENEIFTMMYVVTDNTYLEIERAVLLSNCQLTKCETSMYNSQRGEISNKELSVEFQCLPITGAKVDQAGKNLLQTITGVNIAHTDTGTSRKIVAGDGIKVAALNSNGYEYQNMKDLNGTTIYNDKDKEGEKMEFTYSK